MLKSGVSFRISNLPVLVIIVRDARVMHSCIGAINVLLDYCVCRFCARIISAMSLSAAFSLASASVGESFGKVVFTLYPLTVLTSGTGGSGGGKSLRYSMNASGR